MTEDKQWDNEGFRMPRFMKRDPSEEDSLAFEITPQVNPFWVNEGPPPSVWAYWEGRYRLIDLDS